MPRGIDAALVGNPAAQPHTIDAVQKVARGKLDFRRYVSVPNALHAVDEQRAYAALNLTSARPTLYVASAAGASEARVLEGSVRSTDVRVVDTHPLASKDASGVDLFYRMLVATIVGFVTVFQVIAQAGRLAGAPPLRRLRAGPRGGGVARADARLSGARTRGIWRVHIYATGNCCEHPLGRSESRRLVRSNPN